MTHKNLIPIYNVVARMVMVFAILCLPFRALALSVNDFTFSHLDMSNGLMNQRIYSLRQTADGAVWITTKSGVARYNGSAIASYSLMDKATNHNLIGCNPRFVQGSDSLLQVFDEGGRIYQYNAVQNRFDVVADITHLYTRYNKFNDIYKEGDTYWLAMSEGIYVLRKGKATCVLPKVYANCILLAAKNTLLFGTRQGVKALDAQHRAAPKGRLRDYLPYDAVSGHYDTDTKRLWLGTYAQGLILVDGEGESTSVPGVPQTPVRAIVPYDCTTMLVGIDGAGVYQVGRLSPTDHRATLLFNANNEVSGTLHGNGIYALLVDSWNNIFIGSYSGGVDIARPVGSTVAIYQHQRNNTQSLINDHVNAVLERSPSSVLIGTDDGISMLNPLTDEWRHVARGLVVLAMCEAPDGHLLAATYGHGVCEIDEQGRVTQRYGTFNGTLGEDHVHALLSDRRGHLWIGCQDAELAEVTPQGLRYYPVDNVESLAMMPDGRMAVGTIKGLYLVTPGQREVKELHYFSSNPNEVNRYVLDVFIHDERYIYIATDGGGLYVYDLRTNTCRQLTMADGLPSNVVMSVMADKAGRLWFATERGLSFSFPDSLDDIVDVNYCYGFQREYTHSAIALLENGNLLLGSTNGAVVVNPHFVQKLNYTAKLRFTGVSSRDDDPEAFNDEVARMLEKGKLNLSYCQRNFELYIESINLRNQFDIAYQYKVGKGEWSQMTTQQYIRFVNLEPGTHRLVLRAVSQTSQIVLDERELLITVARPWWNSWWMWCIYIALVAALFYGAWWTYGLHNRYMRLVLGVLERDNTPHAQEEAQPTPDEPQEAEPAEQDNPAFVDTATKLILDHISDTDFNIDRLCRDMAMSRTVFYIKLKSYTGKSPQDFIRIIRLERAAAMLRDGHHVGDVAVAVGFDNAKYFSTVFKKYFGTSPSKYK